LRAKIRSFFKGSLRPAFWLVACSLTFALLSVSADAQTTRTVNVIDHVYSPNNLTVNEGDTVRWVWGNDFHDVVSGSVFNYDNVFRSPVLNRGGSYEVLFDRNLLRSFPRTNNRYPYYCEPHGAMGMTGSITVTRVAKNYNATLQNWQVVPPTSSAATGSCTIQLNAAETQLTWSCTHNATGVSSISIRRGAVGSNGAAFCTVNGSTVSNRTCALSGTDADELVAGTFYVQVTTSTFSGGELRGQVVAAGGSNTVSGQVLRSNGQGVQDVVVSDGTRTATSDAQGVFAFTGVPNGVYRLTASKPGFTIVPASNVTPFAVSGTAVSGRFFEATHTPGAGLQSPVKVLWNGFLGMINILEIINKGSVDMPVTLSLYDIAGNKVHQQAMAVRANGQFDVIVNDLPGFQANSYGIVALEFDSSFNAAIDGRMTNYRPAPGGASYEFVFAVPFVAPLTGTSSVAFNTFQPSRNPTEATHVIAQWLSLVNLDSSSARNFTVKRYDQSGNLLREDTYAIPANGRTDIEGGHVLPGPGTVGLHIIQPENASFPYMAQLYRYSGNAGPGGVPTKYSFAFPLLARAGSGEVQYAPISTSAGAENWLEVANVLSQPVSMVLQYYNQAGALLRQDNVIVPPHAQQHFFAGALLRSGESGSVHIIPNTANALIGQSMYYFRNASGSITAMYGSGMREASGKDFFGSYNLFLNMINALRISNTLPGSNPITLTVYSDTGAPNTRVIELQPHQTIDLSIQDPQYGTHLNSYGQIAVSTDQTDSLLLEVVRARFMPGSSDLDFALPTTVR